MLCCTSRAQAGCSAVILCLWGRIHLLSLEMVLFLAWFNNTSPSLEPIRSFINNVTKKTQSNTLKNSNGSFYAFDSPHKDFSVYVINWCVLPFRWKVFTNSCQKWAFSCSIQAPCFLAYLHCAILSVKAFLLKIFPLKLSAGLPSPGLENTWLFFSVLSAAAAAKSLQSCPTVRPHRRQPTRLPCPWDSPGKNTGVGCHSFSNAWKWKAKVKSLGHVRLLATSWTAAYQTPPSMGVSRQEYWSGVPLPSPSLTLRPI